MYKQIINTGYQTSKHIFHILEIYTIGQKITDKFVHFHIHFAISIKRIQSAEVQCKNVQVNINDNMETRVNSGVIT